MIWGIPLGLLGVAGGAVLVAALAWSGVRRRNAAFLVVSGLVTAGLAIAVPSVVTWALLGVLWLVGMGLGRAGRGEAGSGSGGVAAAWLGVGMAVAATLWLMMWPCFYVGVTRTATVPGEGTGPVGERVCASLIEFNGWGVLGLLAVPVALSCGGLLAARIRSRGVAWVAAALLFAFCVAGAFSIGLYYLPSVAALVVAGAQLGSVSIETVAAASGE